MSNMRKEILLGPRYQTLYKVAVAIMIAAVEAGAIEVTVRTLRSGFNRPCLQPFDLISLFAVANLPLVAVWSAYRHVVPHVQSSEGSGDVVVWVRCIFLVATLCICLSLSVFMDLLNRILGA